ncbi:lipocalin family protein [Aquimarina spongiae]|uniref:Lipocalin-like domain-containing protein n=1 Tax=Aquimarina spongiae TaxID=570521 RepID=A0A1M6B945_9FLAO|nr:lipocalin family protein [Aquimarina spongiae]SHI45261.1 Lipocalin-like domain-containing protein [Aquimarina spongiae]
MKKLILLVAVVIFASCSPTQKTVISAKKTLKGEWSLDKISYDRDGIFDVTLYNDASAECFTGSTWKFIPNNNTGKYEVNQSSCTSTGARNFRFTIPKPEADGTYYFLFKPINEKKKSTNNNAGYRMALQHLDDATMSWAMTVSLEGKPFVITMNFNKLQ